MTGLSRDEVIEAHTATSWHVAFGGFAPGLRLPDRRRQPTAGPAPCEPRTTVPAGSVALAGEFSAVYPRSSPGGWQLLGRTDAVIWDLERDPPALLRPGTIGALRRAGAMSRALQVLATGPLTLIQDLGRPGLAALGVGRSGAADRGAFRLGARLLAQDYASAALEVTFGGLAVRAHGDLMVALTGAEAPVTIDDRQVAHRSPFPLRDGETLRIGTPAVGLRTYLSVRGGVDVPAVLGSRATDTLSGIGPPPVKVGDLLPVGPPPRTFPVVDHAPAPRPTARAAGAARAGRPAGGLACRARRADRSHLERVQPQRSGRDPARGAGAASAPGVRRTGAAQRRRRSRSHPGPGGRRAGAVSGRSSGDRWLSGGGGGSRG